jgi:hypothetical protein
MAYSKLASYYLHWISKINLWSCIKGNNKTCIDLNKVHPRVKYTHTHMRSKIHLPFIIYCGVEKDNTLLTFDGVDTKKLHQTFVPNCKKIWIFLFYWKSTDIWVSPTLNIFNGNFLLNFTLDLRCNKFLCQKKKKL